MKKQKSEGIRQIDRTIDISLLTFYCTKIWTVLAPRVKLNPLSDTKKRKFSAT